MGRMQTHSFGLKCATCQEVLVPDDCRCDTPHGYTFQDANAWAAEHWPDHPCFQQANYELAPENP